MKRVAYPLLTVSFMVILVLATWACAPSAPAHGTRIVLQADISMYKPSEADGIMQTAIRVIKARLDAAGIVKSTVEQQGADRISIRMSDQVDQRLIGAITRQAVLEFGELVSGNETFRWEDQLGKWKPATGVVDNQTLELTSQYFKDNTYVTRGNLGQILLIFEWNSEGSQLSEQITGRLIDKPLGIFEGEQPLLDEDGVPIAPTVQAVITDKGQIEGLNLSLASRLSQQLNAGRLLVPLTVVESQSY